MNDPSDQTDPAHQTLTLPQALQVGIEHHNMGRLTKAEHIYRQILQVDPNHADALRLLGMLAHQMGQHELALQLIQNAIEQRSDYAEAYGELGIVFSKLGDPKQSIIAYQQAIALQPHYFEAYYNLGNAFTSLGQFEAALEAFQKAIDLHPDFPDAHNNLGNRLRDLGKLEESLAVFQMMTHQWPDYFKGHNNLSQILREMGQLEASCTVLVEVVNKWPQHVESLINLGSVTTELGQLQEAVTYYRRVLELDPNATLAYSNLLVTLPFMSNIDGSEILEIARRFGKQFDRAFPDRPRYFEPEDLDPERILRIGYIAPNLMQHVLVDNMEPLFKSHRRDHVSVHVYAHVPKPDMVTKRLKEMVDEWTFIHMLTDDQVADRIIEDGIDILVEVMGHWSENRLMVLARKPAPIQVSYLCQGLTTGLGAIDYAIGDRWVNADQSMQQYAVEKVLELEHGFQVVTYRPSQRIPISAPPCESNENITFASFSNPAKISNKTLDLWSAVLMAVPGSKLLLKGKGLDTSERQERMLRKLSTRGINRDRVELLGMVEGLAYLSLFNNVDIVLDTYPFTGGRTTTDALWMGVPVVSLVGTTVCGRLSYDSLGWIGATELAAHTESEFVKIAMTLAQDHKRLGDYRKSLRTKLERSPLMDADLHVTELETAYRWMWHAWLNQHSPCP
ncbi:MAG: tetratricopeptide repeat protein [Magnetococcales bacterium]|nr:tetratricopeptide repeat protein [Magnetococcales bacterium]